MIAADPTYVNDELYAALAAEAERSRADTSVADPAVSAAVEAFLFLEARLLDSSHFDAWFDLFSATCVYWIPLNPSGGDPRHEISIIFDDNRRLGDRVARLSLESAHSQHPPSRTRRILGNVEAWPREAGVRAYANFVLHESRREITSAYAGWIDYLLVKHEDSWKIQQKIVNLIDSEQGLGNITFLF